MKNLSITFGAACLLSLIGASTAHAQDAAPAAETADATAGGDTTAGHASVAALLGYGFKDGVKLGLGVRGGYTLPMNVYVGGTFVYHLGKTQSSPFGDIHYGLYYLGVEGGYDLNLSPVVLRPYLGLGYAKPVASVAGITVEGDSKFALWPGATVLFPVSKSVFVGADARFLVVSDSNALSVFATGGMQF